MAALRLPACMCVFARVQLRSREMRPARQVSSTSHTMAAPPRVLNGDRLSPLLRRKAKALEPLSAAAHAVHKAESSAEGLACARALVAAAQAATAGEPDCLVIADALRTLLEAHTLPP